MGVDAEMLVKVRGGPIPPRRVKRLGYELACAFGHEKFFVSREHNYRALESCDVYEQDGPDIRPKKGEQFMRVRLWGRYYGPGYERGDLPFYVAVAEWLERRVPLEAGVTAVEVWYGGDSSGICAERFDAKARSKLLDLFAKSGHRPYRDHFTMGTAMSRHCEFCDEPMRQCLFGGGGHRGGFECDGCGLYEVTNDLGKTWATEKRP